ncbi:30S ribosomal protein S16 [Stomatohabitans albus]|uniref:30S ribosomal protein S16 n=1 Tax=Stomatohabitans albus TaxID=3110766 RepID=UPI00300D3A7B
MAVRMRLRREGKKKQPFYRVVVADSRSPRDGRYIEDIGYYQPTHDPSTIEIKNDRALYWLGVGAQPSDQVKQLLRITGVWEEFKPGDKGRDRTAQHEAKAAKAAERDKRVAEALAADAARVAEALAAKEAEIANAAADADAEEAEADAADAAAAEAEETTEADAPEAE